MQADRKAYEIHKLSISVLILIAALTASCTQANNASLSPASLVHTTDTSLFSPPAPDPAGITYIPSLNTLLISDSEVDGLSIFTGENVFEMSRSGRLMGTFSTVSFTIEPTGVAHDAIDMVLFFSDDDKREVFVVNAGPDRVFDTPDDTIASFDTASFGSNDPEGIAFDSLHGVLYLVDGSNAEVYRISAGANGIFDGEPPVGDDQVSKFDTAILGVKDPEGIAFNPDTGNLIVVGEPEDRIIEITTTGGFVRMIDISAAHAVNPAGLTFAPGSLNSTALNIYIVDRGVDDGVDPDENDGKVYEFSIPP